MTKIDLTAAAIIIQENKVLLILHKKLKKWLGPGGHIEPNEVPDDAVIREAYEETGLQVKIVHQPQIPLYGAAKRELAIPFYVNVHSVGDHDHCGFYYLCQVVGGTLNPNLLETEGAQWFTIEQVKDHPDILPDTKEILKLAFKRYR